MAFKIALRPWPVDIVSLVRPWPVDRIWLVRPWPDEINWDDTVNPVRLVEIAFDKI